MNSSLKTKLPITRKTEKNRPRKMRIPALDWGGAAVAAFMIAREDNKCSAFENSIHRGFARDVLGCANA
jgi:hypothetical protein